MRLMKSAIIFLILVLGDTYPALAQEASKLGSAEKLADFFPYILVAFILLVFVISLAKLGQILGSNNPNWSLSDALSEEVDMTPLDKDGKLMAGFDKADKMTVMRASVSRVIALLGLVTIMTIYVGVGLVMVRNLAAGNGDLQTSFNKDTLDRINNFLFAGVTMFAPYLVNKFSSIFDWLRPK